MASLAQMDRELSLERTMAGLEAARKAGRVGGRASVATPEEEAQIIAQKAAGATLGELRAAFPKVSRSKMYAILAAARRREDAPDE